MADEAERQLVVFDLAGEAYGVNIGTVREIIRMFRLRPPAAAPQAWPWHVQVRTLGGFEVIVDA